MVAKIAGGRANMAVTSIGWKRSSSWKQIAGTQAPASSTTFSWLSVPVRLRASSCARSAFALMLKSAIGQLHLRRHALQQVDERLEPGGVGLTCGPQLGEAGRVVARHYLLECCQRLGISGRVGGLD